MDLSSLFGNVYFSDFQDLVEFMCSGAPVCFLTVFIINLLFSIFDDISHLGGRK